MPPLHHISLFLFRQPFLKREASFRIVLSSTAALVAWRGFQIPYFWCLCQCSIHDSFYICVSWPKTHGTSLTPDEQGPFTCWMQFKWNSFGQCLEYTSVCSQTASGDCTKQNSQGVMPGFGWRQEQYGGPTLRYWQSVTEPDPGAPWLCSYDGYKWPAVL